MVRPMKQGLDYFPMDVSFTRDVKVRRVHMACGMESIGILVYLLSLIYRDQGYYEKWDEELCFLTAMDLHLAESLVEQVVQKAAQVGFFDGELLADWGILTSVGIQERFLAATRKRKVRRLIQEYLLVDVAEEGKIELHSIRKDTQQTERKAENSLESFAGAEDLAKEDSYQAAPEKNGAEQRLSQDRNSLAENAQPEMQQPDAQQPKTQPQDFDWVSLTAAEPTDVQLAESVANFTDKEGILRPAAAKNDKTVVSDYQGQDQENQPIPKGTSLQKVRPSKAQIQVTSQDEIEPREPVPVTKGKVHSQTALERENWLANQRNRYLWDPERFTLDNRYALTPDELAWIYNRVQ
ncbi:DUF4373 domain-containing protein [Enterococcus asini]|uniref:DUF4373 domain-containing protein n=1 Tax=Enterococcus asini TaxID=57732 RepID=UPI0026DD0F46|nr:DUF4373 domain-containing protein [Enterococcus asini]